jgi:Tol biopolymer transport system component/predicted Ser/Thr protein kinase
MTAERWAHITEVFRAALDKPAAERPAFLAEACGSDELLRRSVEGLLAGEGDPAAASPAPRISQTGTLDLASGETLAHYRVEGKIGEGGIGAVYRAYDSRLRRNVALKILLPERFADLERKHRLLREAHAASGLNHPNIVTIYEIGSDRDVDFIAMEYIEGKTLDELIPREGMRPAQALRYAVQIADALAKAHGAGILHRDLKPSNIMATPEGRIKLLDFGLAKVLEPPDTSPDAPTVTAQYLTEEGTVLGTAAYMSPEQAEGRKLDARSDIFAFGSVLYEMATGRRPFSGDSRLALMSKIVNEDPLPPGQLAALPPDVEKLILRCLRKDVSRRYQSMADLRVALEDLETETSGTPLRPSSAAAAAPRARTAVQTGGLIAAVILVAVLAIFIALRVLRPTPQAVAVRTVKFTITPSNLVRGGYNEVDAEVSISRDGEHITYVESQGGQLWIRDIDQEGARPVPGASAVYQAFWSPDNRSIGYAAGSNCGGRGGCDLVRIPAEGGTPALVAKLQGGFKRACWSSDGQTILYADSSGMYTVPEKGGPVTQILKHSHLEHPSFVDLAKGRRAFLYQAVDAERPGGHGIYIQVAGENRRRFILLSTSSNPYPVYSPTGHIVYVDGQRDGTAVWALPFSLETLEATGKPFPIAQHGSSPVVSLTGTLVYSDVPSDRQQLTTVDRSGATLATMGEPQRQNDPTFSPDGRKLAVVVTDTDPDIWIYDLDRGIRSRLTSDPAAEILGAWTPSGDQITYASNRNRNFDIFSKPSSGAGEATLLVGTPAMERALDWSRDQNYLLYMTGTPETQGDLMYRERGSDGALGEAKVFMKTPANETFGQFSPDGRFVVYASDQSGTTEIYVRDFPRAANQWQISDHGGFNPRWSRDGKEIYYLAEGGVMAVSIAMRPAFSPAAPVRLFEKRGMRTAALFRQYDISPDGKRFAILEKPPGEPPLSIHVVHNWFEEFRGGQQSK